MSTTLVERTVTQLDFLRLNRLVARVPGAPANPLQESMAELLANSDLVHPTAVASDVVTMQSQVLLADPDGGEPYALTLCYPEQAEPSEGRYSVLSPLGVAVLGQRVGALATWHTPHGGERSVTIQKMLFQPEASGDYVA